MNFLDIPGTERLSVNTNGLEPDFDATSIGLDLPGTEVQAQRTNVSDMETGTISAENDAVLRE